MYIQLSIIVLRSLSLSLSISILLAPAEGGPHQPGRLRDEEARAAGTAVIRT